MSGNTIVHQIKRCKSPEDLDKLARRYAGNEAALERIEAAKFEMVFDNPEPIVVPAPKPVPVVTQKVAKVRIKQKIDLPLIMGRGTTRIRIETMGSYYEHYYSGWTVIQEAQWQSAKQ